MAELRERIDPFPHYSPKCIKIDRLTHERLAYEAALKRWHDRINDLESAIAKILHIVDRNGHTSKGDVDELRIVLYGIDGSSEGKR